MTRRNRPDPVCPKAILGPIAARSILTRSVENIDDFVFTYLMVVYMGNSSLRIDIESGPQYV